MFTQSDWRLGSLGELVFAVEGIAVVSATRSVTEDGNATNVWEFEAGEGVGSKFPVAVGNIWISNEEPIVS